MDKFEYFWQTASRDLRKAFIDEVCNGKYMTAYHLATGNRAFTPERAKLADQFFSSHDIDITRSDLRPDIWDRPELAA